MSNGDEVQRLLDVEAIRVLKARDFRCMDQKKWDEWGLVFSRDAHMIIPDHNTTVTGREAIVEYVRTALSTTLSVHHGHMPEIEITGENTARGIWAMDDYNERPAQRDGSRTGIHGYGHYYEDYVREDGEWRIERVELVRLRLDPL